MPVFQRVGVFAPFLFANGYRHFGLESGIVFKRTTGVYELFNVSIPNE